MQEVKHHEKGIVYMQHIAILQTPTFGSIFCNRSPASASPLTLSNTLRHLYDGMDMEASLSVIPPGEIHDI